MQNCSCAFNSLNVVYGTLSFIVVKYRLGFCFTAFKKSWNDDNVILKKALKYKKKYPNPIPNFDGIDIYI